MDTRITGNDPAAGADPGGTHSTKPGNPDKRGKARPERVGESEREHVVSGDRNDGADPGRDPQKHPDT